METESHSSPVNHTQKMKAGLVPKAKMPRELPKCEQPKEGGKMI